MRPTRTHVAWIVLSALLSTAAGPPSSQAEETLPAAPEWARQHIAEQIGGAWLTDNAAYRSEQEPADAYGIEWRAGLSDGSMTGRLFGLRDGRELGTYWQFRVFWHPGEEELVVQQFGADGTVGTGTLRRTGESRYRSEQTFFTPGGTARENAHDLVRQGEDVHRTDSFDRVDGEWQPRRSYVWRRAPATGEKGEG